MKIKKKIIEKETLNFIVGMLLGMAATFIYPVSKLNYYFVFCPGAIAIFIAINKKRKTK